MSGASRVSIPDSLRRTIQDIKEIAGDHSDEDVLAMLKDCNMDPNETAQKLLHLDTFHEVKRKRERRKMSANNRVHKEYQRIPGMQRRGTRSGRENYSSSPYNSDDAIGGRQINARQENGYNSTTGRASKSSVRNLHKKSDGVPSHASSKVPVNGSSLSNGSSNHELTSQLAERYIGGVIRDAKAHHGDKSRKLPSLRTLMVKQLLTMDPGPTPAPTPTNTSTVETGGRIQVGNLNLKSSHLGSSVNSPSVSGLYSSASDPVLVPSLNPRNPGTVGIIKRETGNQRNTAEISADCRVNAVQNAPIGQAVSGSVDLTSDIQSIELQGDEMSQRTQSSQLPSSTSHKSNQETNCQVNGPSKEILSEAPGVPAEGNLKSLPSRDDPSSKSEVDIKLHKLNMSARQSVVFPNHLHVPEAIKNVLTFGSLDATLGQSNGDSNSKDASQPNIEAAKEPSPIDKSSSQTSGNGDNPDRPPSPPHMAVNLTQSQENISSGTALRYDQSKQDVVQPVGGSYNPHIPPMPDYSLSLLPPVLGPHLVQPEGLEPQGGNSLTPSATGSTPYVTQARGITQSSIPLSPQLFPFLRQPYTPNYIPYSPYFSHLYMSPQNAHQLLSHSGFPQQSSPGNIYMPPTAAAASGVRFPITPVYKPGNVSGNLAHPGISPGYGAYGPLPPVTSACNDDIAASELKEKTMYSTSKQNEDMHALSSTSGRDISALQANLFYNVPQGQTVTFSPGHNFYHPSQSMSAPSLVHSQAIGGSVDSIVPPLSSYYQQQPHFLPITQPQYGQMNWNQKLINRDNI